MEKLEMVALAHDTQNDTRLEDFEAFVKDCANASAKGKDALPNLAIGFVRAVADEVVTPDKDKDGDDAAARYFKKYTAQEGKKAFHDRSQASQKAQISKLRQLQNAASNPKFDFVDVLNRAVSLYQDQHKLGSDLKSPFPAYVDVAREQLKFDDALDDEVIIAVILKGTKTTEVTLEGQLKKAAKILEDIITGEKHPGVHDQSAEVMVAAEQINTRITALTLIAAQNEVFEKAKALGLTVS
jgi:hypothetical protein